jgi:glucose/arabinose dehydrogenase
MRHRRRPTRLLPTVARPGRRRPARRRSLLIVPLALFLVASLTSCSPPPTLTVTALVPNLDHPWDISFAPGDVMFYTERVGRIDARVGGVHRVLATPSDVLVASEAGMMGVAVDPNFATNRRLFTCFASTISGGNDIRVVRWTVNAGVTALANRTDILTGIPVNNSGQTGRHAGCRTRFGPDGFLWVTTGDAATNTNPQSPTSLGGKVLRIDGNGAGAPGNAGGAFRSEIYTYGHRNPQGVTWRPTDGQAFSIEHGTDCDDEINKLVRGANYGWDPVPPGGGTTYDESRPMTDFTKFPNAKPAVWSSGCPTIAPSGGTFLSGTQWKAWNNGLAMAVLKGSQLHVVSFFNNDTKTLEWTDITNRGRLRVAVEGPDGNLYVAQDANPGAILKVVPS